MVQANSFSGVSLNKLNLLKVLVVQCVLLRYKSGHVELITA
jgi:hypothetical protein